MAECAINKIDSNLTGLAFAEEECLKQLPVAGPAVAASGTLTVTSLPAVGNTFVVNGVTYTFIANGGSPTGNEIALGTDAPTTAAAINTKLAAAADIGASVSANVVTITADVAGAAGNLIDTTTTSGSIAFSGATLTGGKDETFDPVWYDLEPNSYSDFGGENTTVARAPIDPSRQNKKGTITDLDASGGFNIDFTHSNLVRLMQGFFFADAREGAGTQPLNGEPVALTAVSATQYQASSGLNRFKAGEIVMASGFGAVANNGVKNVTAAVAGSVTVSQPLTVEASPPATAKLQRIGWQFAAADIAVTMNGNVASLQATAGDFTNLGLTPGQLIFIGGDAVANRFANNVGYARVRSIAAKVLVLDDTTWTPQAEAGTGKTIQVFIPTVIRNEKDPQLIKRRSYNIERTLGEGLVDTQAEYLEGAVANEFTLNVPQADKLNADMTFVACDNTYRSGDVGDKVKVGTHVPAAGEEAYNTSSDIYRIKMSVKDPNASNPAALFGYVSEADISINNNVTPNKAIGVLGAFDTSAGNFEVGGTITAYFTTVAAVKAVRANADVGLSIIGAAKGQGFFFDIPLLSLGGGRINIEKDQPITVPLEPAGAENEFGYTMMYGVFQYLPDVAMPV